MIHDTPLTRVSSETGVSGVGSGLPGWIRTLPLNVKAGPRPGLLSQHHAAIDHGVEPNDDDWAL